MGGVKSLFKGPPKPKKDKEAERLQAEALAKEKAHAKSLEQQAASSRRARYGNASYGRSLLSYASNKETGTLG